MLTAKAHVCFLAIDFFYCHFVSWLSLFVSCQKCFFRTLQYFTLTPNIQMCFISFFVQCNKELPHLTTIFDRNSTEEVAKLERNFTWNHPGITNFFVPINEFWMKQKGILQLSVACRQNTSLIRLLAGHIVSILSTKVFWLVSLNWLKSIVLLDSAISNASRVLLAINPLSRQMSACLNVSYLV